MDILYLEKTRMSVATIYPNVLKAMSDREMTVKDLANVLGISDQATRRRLLGKANGGTDISAYECHVLCEHFNAAFEWLFATGDRA